MPDPVQLAVSRAPLGGHLWHLLLLASWFPIFAVIVIVERLRGRDTSRLSSPTSLHGRALSPQSATATGDIVPDGRTGEIISVALALDDGVVGVSKWPVAGDSRSGVMWCQAMAVSSVSAALIHLAVMPSHFRQSVWYGSFFLGAALGQVYFASMVLSKPSRRWVMAGVAGSTLVVALWLITRIVGVPIGPDNGATEPFGLLDILASVAEIATAVFGGLALHSWSGRPAWRLSQWSRVMRLAAGVSIVVAVAASILGSRS